MKTLDTKTVLNNFMVNCMLNKENKDFYIGTMTPEKAQEIINNMQDEDFETFFWNAFFEAQKQIAQPQDK